MNVIFEFLKTCSLDIFSRFKSLERLVITRAKKTGNSGNIEEYRGMHFIHININSFLPETDEVGYIANITNTSIIGISETKLDKTIWSSELEVDDYDLVRLDQSRRGGGVACYIKKINCI